MCVLSIKVALRKNSGNLFNDPRLCICLLSRKAFLQHEFYKFHFSGKQHNGLNYFWR